MAVCNNVTNRNHLVVPLLGFGLMIAIQLLITYIWMNGQSSPRFTQIYPPKYPALNMSNVNVDEFRFKQQLIDVAMHLKRARLHVRGFKTSIELKHACNSMNEMLQNFGTSFEDVTKRNIYESDSVCPEYYVDLIYGYKVQNCSFSKPLEKIVTIVRLDYGSNDSTRFYNRYNGNISVIVGNYGEKLTEQKGTHTIHLESSIKEGEALNKLIAGVKTKYTLVVRNATGLDSDSRIERLVREIERLNVSAVGGSIRNSDTIWKLGCHQRVFRNFTVVYREGYDESIHDCVFCDHVDGPFLIRTDQLKQVQFDVKLTQMGLFEDFFMRLNGEVAVCPDSMFNMDFPKRSEITTDWEKFGRKRNLYKLKFSIGLTIFFGCSYRYPCDKTKGYVRSPCCIKELADLKNGLLEMCEKAGVPCKLNAGTLLGALKYNNVISWEIDGDIIFWCEDFDRLWNARNTLLSKGFRLGFVQKPQKNCTASRNPAYGSAVSKNWFVDFYACSTYKGSYILRSTSRDLTKILHYGRLVYVDKNPSLAARSVYPELYQNQAHYREGGGQGTVFNAFTKCPKPGNHNCLDNYYSDGNIQVNDPLA